MSIIEDYITSNDLPCTFWLDGTDDTTITYNSESFTWRNKLGNINYDFLQTDNTKLPTKVGRGVSFSSDQFLYPRTNQIFSNKNTYSLIFITQTDTSNEQQILSVRKEVTAKPYLLTYNYNESKLNQGFSILNISDQITSEVVSDEVIGSIATQSVIINHNIKFGNTSICIDSTNFNTQINRDKGFIIDINLKSIKLGNSIPNLPLTGIINHVMMFSPVIAESDLIYISGLLFDTVDRLRWDNITVSLWNSLTEDDWNNIE